MKYFKHDLTAFHDDKIWSLIETHGMQAYGIWWWLLEQLYAAEENGFLIEATEIWFKKSSKSMNLSDWRTLIRTLDAFSEAGLIDSQLWAEHHIFCPGIIKRADRYISQKVAAKERKRLQRERDRAGNTTDCHTGVTRDNADVTACHTGVTTNTDPDPDPDTDPDTNSFSDPEPDLKKENEPVPVEVVKATPLPVFRQGSDDFMTDRPWIEKWGRVNPVYDEGFCKWCIPKIGRFDAYKSGATIGDVKRYLAKANYDTDTSFERAASIAVWWEEYKKSGCDRTNQPQYTAGSFPWEVRA